MTLTYALSGVAESTHSFEPTKPIDAAILPEWKGDYAILARLAGHPAAKAAMAAYRSLGEAFADDNALLVIRAGSKAAVGISALRDLHARAMGAYVRRRPVISSWSALLAYVKAAMQHEGREQFRVLFLDKKNQLICDHIMHEGTVDHAPVYPREVCRMALLVNASAVILAHNHPSGDPEPSLADIDMTKQVVAACLALRITVHDHLVVGRDGVRSLKALGHI